MSVLKGVVLAAALGGRGTGAAVVVSEEFLLRDTKSFSDKWTFPCLDAASSAAHAAATHWQQQLALAAFVLWCAGAFVV